MANIVILGRSREGKSTLALAYARGMKECVIFWDRRHAVVRRDAIYCENVDQLHDAIYDRRYPGHILVLRPIRDERILEQFEDFCDFIFARLRSYAFIVDEAGMDIQKSQTINAHLREMLISHGTEKALIIQTTHFSADLFRTSQGIANEVWIFRTKRPTDLDNISDQWGEDCAEAVAELPPHHYVRCYLDRREDSGPEWEVMNEPDAWFLQLDEREPLPRKENKEDGEKKRRRWTTEEDMVR